MLNFNRADERVLKALCRLKAPEMAPLLEFIENQLEDAKTALVSADDEGFRQVQGRAKYLADFVGAVKAASEFKAKV